MHLVVEEKVVLNKSSLLNMLDLNGIRHSRISVYLTESIRLFYPLMYRTVLWTLWERERVGRFGRMALKHVKDHV